MIPARGQARTRDGPFWTRLQAEPRSSPWWPAHARDCDAMSVWRPDIFGDMRPGMGHGLWRPKSPACFVSVTRPSCENLTMEGREPYDGQAGTVAAK